MACMACITCRGHHVQGRRHGAETVVIDVYGIVVLRICDWTNPQSSMAAGSVHARSGITAPKR